MTRDSGEDAVIVPRLGLASRPQLAARHARGGEVLGRIAAQFDAMKLARAVIRHGTSLGLALGRRAVPVVGTTILLSEVGYHLYRALSGKSYGVVDSELNRFFFGDLDDGARASVAARDYLTRDPELSRIVGVEGRVNSQIRSLYRDVRELRERFERGKSMFEADVHFQSMDTLTDQIIERIRREVFGCPGATRIDRLSSRARGGR